MALVLTFKVVPSSKKIGFFKDKNGTMKCFLKSPPEDGKANKEFIKLLAEKLSLAQSDLEIIAGAFSRHKKVKIHAALSQQEIAERLGLDFQVFCDFLKNRNDLSSS